MLDTLRTSFANFLVVWQKLVKPPMDFGCFHTARLTIRGDNIINWRQSQQDKFWQSQIKLSKSEFSLFIKSLD
ncbi:MAG: hypothetical protein KME01_07265 [Chroococcus sp. CMT-3BRIN-NPC107]|nr:hypothetical protein [Chroococcus sp. CMT-3BRIN-NPC107]